MSNPVHVVVEGDLDARVAERLLAHARLEPGAIYGLKGRNHILSRATSYQRAADRLPFLVLVDLDRDACAPALLRSVGLAAKERFCVRVAVRTVEAWLLADRDNFASWCGVSARIVPRDPEDLNSPKDALINIASRSRSRTIRQELTPRRGSGRRVGPGYVGRLSQFAMEAWDPLAAAQNSPSLARALRCLEAMRLTLTA